jgi:hypothetical protein
MPIIELHVGRKKNKTRKGRLQPGDQYSAELRAVMVERKAKTQAAILAHCAKHGIKVIKSDAGCKKVTVHCPCCGKTRTIEFGQLKRTKTALCTDCLYVLTIDLWYTLGSGNPHGHASDATTCARHMNPCKIHMRYLQRRRRQARGRGEGEGPLRGHGHPVHGYDSKWAVWVGCSDCGKVHCRRLSSLLMSQHARCSSCY